MFVTGLGCCASATVVVSSANSQQGGHDHPMVEGADTKGALHIGQCEWCQNTMVVKSPTVNCVHGIELLRSSA